MFCSRVVIVIGPTPPGTGVIAPAFLDTVAKLQSPHSLPFNLFILTSIIVAPRFIILGFKKFGVPVAVIIISAAFVCLVMPTVLLWHIVTVAFWASNRCIRGLPTRLLRFIITACLPSRAML